jgi:hypothetical protein
MPTVLNIGPYRFFFYSSDHDEPPHVHVERDKYITKFWLHPVRLHTSGGFKRPELNRIQRMVEENQRRLLEAWNEYFSA